MVGIETDDQALDKTFLQELREMKYALGSKEYMAEQRRCITANVCWASFCFCCLLKNRHTS